MRLDDAGDADPNAPYCTNLSKPTTGDIYGLIVLGPTDEAVFVENVAVHPNY